MTYRRWTSERVKSSWSLSSKTWTEYIWASVINLTFSLRNYYCCILQIYKHRVMQANVFQMISFVPSFLNVNNLSFSHWIAQFIVTKNVTLLNDQSKKPEVLNLCYIVSVNMAFIIFWTWFCNKSWNRLFLLCRSINIVNCVTILLFTAHWINLIALVCCVCSMYYILFISSCSSMLFLFIDFITSTR